MGFLLYLHMYQKEVIQTFLQEKILTIDNIIESFDKNGGYITINYLF